MAKTTLEQVIENDPTLDMFINGDIDWFNDHQVALRFSAIKIAISKYISRRSGEIYNEITGRKITHFQYFGRLNRYDDLKKLSGVSCNIIKKIFDGVDENEREAIISSWYDNLSDEERKLIKYSDPNTLYLSCLKHIYNPK